MSKKKSNSEFLVQLSSITNTIKPLESYVDSKTKIKCECLACGNVWYSAPSNLLAGKGCPKCGIRINAKMRTRSNDSFLKLLHEKNPLIEPLDPYKGASKKIRLLCKKCGLVWEAKPNHVLSGHGCPRCAGSLRKSHESFVEELKKINPNVIVLEEYKNARSKVNCQCTICSHEWKVSPSKLLSGADCPNCDRRLKTSFPEQAIFFYVSKFFLDAVNRYRGNLGKYELDIFIPSLSLGIEYDGGYYHTQSERDMQKYKACINAGIRLIRIVEKKPQNSLLADIVLHRDEPFNVESLDKVITELFDVLGIEADINTNRDGNAIREQFYNSLRLNSLASKSPDIASEWNCEKNGLIKPDMVSWATNDKYWWKCKKCGYEWTAAVCDRTTGSKGCPKCGRLRISNKLRKTHASFVQELKDVNPNIIPLEEYQSTHSKIIFRCLRCGNEWSASPANILRGRDCPVCSRRRATEKMKKTKQRKMQVN